MRKKNSPGCRCCGKGCTARIDVSRLCADGGGSYTYEILELTDDQGNELPRQSPFPIPSAPHYVRAVVRVTGVVAQPGGGFGGTTVGATEYEGPVTTTFEQVQCPADGSAVVLKPDLPAVLKFRKPLRFSVRPLSGTACFFPASPGSPDGTYIPGVHRRYRYEFALGTIALSGEIPFNGQVVDLGGGSYFQPDRSGRVNVLALAVEVGPGADLRSGVLRWYAMEDDGTTPLDPTHPCPQPEILAALYYVCAGMCFTPGYSPQLHDSLYVPSGANEPVNDPVPYPHVVGYRWVDYPSSGPINCPAGGDPYAESAAAAPALSMMVAPPARAVAALPPAIRMESADESCNFGMFRSCTLTRGPAPPELRTLGVEGDVYTSAERFPDPISGDTFYYWLIAHDSQYHLTRIYPDFAGGGPYRDAILYAWALGREGNTREPLRLPSGSPFPGSDSTCRVGLFDAELPA